MGLNGTINNFMLKIGFYGHSICSNNFVGTYLNSVLTHFDARLVNQGTGMASEERILFELKKTRPDIAVIFHSQPHYLFLPKYPRDCNLIDSEDTIHRIIQHKNFGFDGKSPTPWSEKELIERDLYSLPEAVKLYRKHIYHTEVHNNRYYGAMMMIDSVCLNTVPVTIHIPILKFLPNWFKLQSGQVLTELSKIVDRRAPGMPNGISIEDNAILENTLIKTIKEELEKKSYVCGS